MINLTVIKLRDIFKYFFKIIIIIVGIILVIKILGLNNTYISNIISKKDMDTFISYLEKEIPGMENSENKEKDINPISIPISMEYLEIENVEEVAIQEDVEQQAVEKDNQEMDGQQMEEQEVQTDVATEVIETGVVDSFTDEYNGVKIKNGTDIGLTRQMLEPNIEIDKSNIVIFHTHTCESYTPTDAFFYEQTGNFRTTDLNYTVARVGDELENNLKSYGYNVIHDKTYHDYPAYSGSYGRSLETVKNILNTTSADIVIDLHRDAIGGDGSYAPTVKIGDEYAAQLMFVIGTNGGGLAHDNWTDNLKFAVKVQEKANEMYPGLFKTIMLRNSRYNQHLSKAATIIEVGATGNTLEQSLVSMKYLAKVIDSL